jgi:hypothetical protein
MRLELFAAYGERDVAKFLVFEEESEVIGQSTFRHLKLYRIALAGYIDAIGYDTNLQR